MKPGTIVLGSLFGLVVVYFFVFCAATILASVLSVFFNIN